MKIIGSMTAKIVVRFLVLKGGIWRALKNIT
jgi:hypothetical protein